MPQDPMYPAGVSDNDPHFSLPSVGDDEDDDLIGIPCSYPGCDCYTTFDPIYGDLCSNHIRAENE